MTAKERKEIAEKVAEIVYSRLSEQLDEMLPITKVMEIYGWSKSYLYNNRKALGGVLACGKVFFSRRTLEQVIRSGGIKEVPAGRTDR